MLKNDRWHQCNKAVKHSVKKQIIILEIYKLMLQIDVNAHTSESDAKEVSSGEL